MTELSDRMVDLLEREFGVLANRDAGKIEFGPLFRDFTLTFDPENAVEDIVDQAANFNEDGFVLRQTIPPMTPGSLPPLKDIREAAYDYLHAVDDTMYRMKGWRKAGMSDEEIKDVLDSEYSSRGSNKLGIDMEHGIVRFDNPNLHRERGISTEMSVDDVMYILKDEWDDNSISDLICEEIGVNGTPSGTPSLVDLMDESHEIHCTLIEMSAMLQEQREIEQMQQDCR